MGIRDEFNNSDRRRVRAAASRADDMGKPPPKLPDELAAAFEVSDRKLGVGSFGTVWLATRRSDGARVALKIIRCADRGAARLAARELALARVLVHPNIVRQLACCAPPATPAAGARGAGEEARHAYAVLELLEGETLLQRLRRCGHLAEAEARPVFAQIVDATRYIHSKGVIHRDLSTNNVMLCAPRAACLLYTSPSPRDGLLSRMPSSA